MCLTLWLVLRSMKMKGHWVEVQPQVAVRAHTSPLSCLGLSVKGVKYEVYDR